MAVPPQLVLTASLIAELLADGQQTAEAELMADGHLTTEAELMADGHLSPEAELLADCHLTVVAWLAACPEVLHHFCQQIVQLLCC